jgi:hypothetical protein
MMSPRRKIMIHDRLRLRRTSSMSGETFQSE